MTKTKGQYEIIQKYSVDNQIFESSLVSNYAIKA